MKASGNGTPETCALNLLRTIRGEVPFDRVRGVDGTLIDRANVIDDVAADIEWVLSTYEPRIEIESIEDSSEAVMAGDFTKIVHLKRKEDK